MNKAILASLSLPGGDGPLELSVFESDAHGVRLGLLKGRDGKVRVPVCGGMPLFTETAGADDRTADEALARRVHAERFDDGGRYAGFVREKFRRPVYDAYGGFQPFNEACRAIFPLLPYLSASLRPGDLILDLSNRNGWTGELLAGLFPEQQVLTLWDGNSGVLAYAGFSFWLGGEDRAPNLTVGMHPAGEGLPVKSGSVRLIVGYDCLHRFDASKLLDECRRAAAPDATIIFPHVHLESATSPEFERGGTHLTAAAYRKLLDEKFAKDDRKGFVFAERGLFDDQYPAVKDDSATTHYNGTVFIGPRAVEGKTTAKCRLPAPKASFRLLVNPLCAIDLDHRRVGQGTANMGDQGAHLLSRHPVYQERLDRVLPQDLSTPECEILFWASRALTLGEIAQKTGLPLDDVYAAARRFEDHEIALAYPVSEGMARLHHYYATQKFLAPRAEHTLKHLFRDAAARHGDRKLFVYAADGSEFSYEDTRQGVERVATALAKAGLKKGDIIAADAELSPEFALLFWAAMERGLIVASLNPAWPESTTGDVVKACNAKLVFLPSRRAAGHAGAIVFDSSVDENATPGGRLFSEWMENAEADGGSEAPPVDVRETDVAAIIFTSGTTGLPKGVMLSHGALYRSARNLVQEYGWTKDDVLLIPGEFHSIGGLRGPLVAVLQAGASFVLTTTAQRRHPLSVLPVVNQTGTTILNVTPAFLLELGKARDRMPDAELPTVRLVLSTAAALTPAAAAALKPFPKLKLGNYYGLTESTGASIYQHDIDTTGSRPWEPGLIGRPAGIIVHVVDEDGKPVPAGVVGEVCLYSENLMSGYLNNPTEAAQMLRHGWLRTGDLGVMTPAGWVSLKGRKREIIKDDFGDIISPLEIEACLGADPGVEEAAVCGFSDPTTAREALVAFVVPKAGAASADELVGELRQRVAEKLGVRKVPKNFQVVEKFPRNSLGKVLKRDLIEDYLNARKKT